MSIPRAHLENRYAMAERWSKAFYRRGMRSDLVKRAGEEWWEQARIDLREDHNPSQDTRDLIVWKLQDLESGEGTLRAAAPHSSEEGGSASTSSASTSYSPSEPSETPVAGTRASEVAPLSSPPATASVSSDASRLAPPRGQAVQASFDLNAARDARDKGMERASEDDPAWNLRALQAVRRLAERRESFIVDEVWVELGEPEPKNARAMGPVMLAAARQGFIDKTDEYKASARVSAHKNPRRVWRSLLYKARVSA